MFQPLVKTELNDSAKVERPRHDHVGLMAIGIVSVGLVAFLTQPVMHVAASGYRSLSRTGGWPCLA